MCVEGKDQIIVYDIGSWRVGGIRLAPFITNLSWALTRGHPRTVLYSLLGKPWLTQTSQQPSALTGSILPASVAILKLKFPTPEHLVDKFKPYSYQREWYWMIMCNSEMSLNILNNKTPSSPIVYHYQSQKSDRQSILPSYIRQQRCSGRKKHMWPSTHLNTLIGVCLLYQGK